MGRRRTDIAARPAQNGMLTLGGHGDGQQYERDGNHHEGIAPLPKGLAFHDLLLRGQSDCVQLPMINLNTS